MRADRRRDTVIEALCAVKSELPLSAHVACEPADVARRAYEFYELRGRVDGFDADDWRQAERELSDYGAGRRASPEGPNVPDAPPNPNPPNTPPSGVPKTPSAPPTPTDEPPPKPIDDPPPEVDPKPPYTVQT